MTNKLEMYRCKICGNLVEIIVPGDGALVCCGEEMEHLKCKKNDDEFNEKHVPIISHDKNGETEIRVGSVAHPMLEEHYIMFIETITKDENRSVLQYLHPGEEPIMYLNDKMKDIKAREFCNIHGLWGGDSD